MAALIGPEKMSVKGEILSCSLKKKIKYVYYPLKIQT